MRSKVFVWMAVLSVLSVGTLFAVPQILAQVETERREVVTTGSTTESSGTREVSSAAAEIKTELPLAKIEQAVDSDSIASGPGLGAMRIERTPDRVDLKGSIARLEDRDALTDAARLAFPTSAVDMRLVQEQTVATDQLDAALLAIEALSRLAEGRADIAANKIIVTGRALYAQMPALLAARLEERTPSGWTIALEIDAPEAAAANGGAQCRQGIVERLAKDQIGFAVAAAALQPDAEPLLDDLAEILGQCPKVAVEIAGHTDSDGSEAANRRLSQERAAAVRRALSERGVDAGRLSAVGYGQAQPIAANDTPENKALNRRIELIMIE